MTPSEKEILKFAKDFNAHNLKKFGVFPSVTQALIAEKFGFSKQNISLYGKSLEGKRLINRAKGKGSAFWEVL